jgi:hypothetical protein
MHQETMFVGHDYLRFQCGDVRFEIAENVDGLSLDQLDALARWLEDWEEDVAQNAIEEYVDGDSYNDSVNDVERMGHDRGWDDAMSKATDAIDSIFDDLGEALDGADEDDTYQALYDRVCEVWESRKARLEAL